MITPPPRPRLWLRWAGQSVEFDQAQVIVGRGADCDVVITAGHASRHHLTFTIEAGAWLGTDTSSNGTFVTGQRIGRIPIGTAPVSMRLGDLNGEELTAWMVAPAAGPEPAKPPAPSVGTRPAPRVDLPPPTPGTGVSAPPPVLPPGQLADGQAMIPTDRNRDGLISIGRELSNEVVLNDPLVSRVHARLDLRTATLTDLGSFNGTFVNGRRLTGAVQLQPGAEVIVGNQAFRWDGNQLAASSTQSELTLYADGLSVEVAAGKRLLDNMTFQLAPSSLTAVIGPSGAGKSTLLGALTGLRPATHGRVVWQGHDLYTHYDQLRFQIGLVPQQDIQHPQLKVRQALSYAAELRLPPDTTAAERAARVQTVAGQLQLQQRLENRIGTQLSGGQRKRVSIATELLTAPPLLFLDEPTSGLDPGLDLEVMRQLRSLADDGRVVMVVTHSVLALDVCDNVIVLAPGGRMAYFGPPAGVLAHFGVANYPEVFDMLDDPDLWNRIALPQPNVDAVPLSAQAAGVPAPPRQDFTKQLSTLVRRNLAVVLADRLLLTMLIALPLILGALSRLVPGDNGFSLDNAQVFRDDPVTGLSKFAGFSPEEARQRLIVLIVAACLMGVAMTIRELVGERPIFQREYAVGLSPGVYLLSKVLVLGSAAFAQGVLVTIIATVGLPGPDGGAGVLRVALAIGALAFCMAVIGLCLSALVTSSEQTMPALVGMIMIQLVLSGSLFPVNGRPLLEQIAWLAPSRWGYAAIGSVLGIERSNSAGEAEDWIALAGAGHYLFAVILLALLTAGSLGAGFWLVRRSATAA